MNIENVLSEEFGQLTDQVADFFAGGGCFRELHDISDETMEAIYSVAYNFYKNEKYEEALKVFKMLGMYDHYNHKYFMGLAGCQQMLQQYSGAIKAYSYAALMDIYDPLAPLHAGECYLALGDFEQAINGFKAALEFSAGKSEHIAIQIKAEKMLAIAKPKLA